MVTLVLLFALSAVSTASDDVELTWSVVGQCRASCVQQYLFWWRDIQHTLTESTCLQDYTGCYTCWRMCAQLFNDQSHYGFLCKPHRPKAQCSDGCGSACNFKNNHAGSDLNVASKDRFQMNDPEVGFYNESSFAFSIENPVPSDYVSWAVVFVVFYRHLSTDSWTYFVSTYEQFVLMNGQYQDIGLQVKILAVTEEGVVARSLLDIDYLYNISQAQNTTDSDAIFLNTDLNALDIIALSALGCYALVVVLVCVFLYCYHKRSTSDTPEGVDSGVHFRRYNTDIDSQVTGSNPSYSTPLNNKFKPEAQPAVSDVDSMDSSPLSDSYYSTGIQMRSVLSEKMKRCSSSVSLEGVPPQPHNTPASVHTYEDVHDSSSLASDDYIYIDDEVYMPWMKYHTISFLGEDMEPGVVDSTWDDNTSVVI